MEMIRKHWFKIVVVNSFLVVIHARADFKEKHCILSQWSQWTSCNTTCSIGVSTISRHIIQHPQGFFAKGCHPNTTHTRNCGLPNNGCEKFCDERTGKCLCPSGYELGRDGKKCFDVNECLHNRGLGACSQVCKNTVGSYECKCSKGFQLAADRHDCINSTLQCSDLHFQSKVPESKCVCRNGLAGVECDRDLLRCSTRNRSVCNENDLCMTYIHAPDRCVPSFYQVPILLEMKFSTFSNGDSAYLVEKYIRSILEGYSKGNTIHSLLQGTSKTKTVGKIKRLYFVESIQRTQVKSSFTYAKFVVLDTRRRYEKLPASKVCSLLKSTDIPCVGENHCEIMRSDGVPCPATSTYNNLEIIDTGMLRNEQKNPSILIILICCGILVIAVVLLTIYLKRRSKRPLTTHVTYQSSPSQHILLRNEYDPVDANDSMNMSSPTHTLDGDNFDLYNNDSGSLNNSGPIYESISSLKKRIDEEMDNLASDDEDGGIAEARYVEPRNISSANRLRAPAGTDAKLVDGKDICQSDDSINERGKLTVELCDSKNEKGQLTVDMSEEDEPRYSEPPGRR